DAMTGRVRAGYLPEGLPIPVAEPDGLSAPYWAGLRQNRLMVQRCNRCQTWQFGPEWLCHRCHAFDPGVGRGRAARPNIQLGARLAPLPCGAEATWAISGRSCGTTGRR